MKTITMDLSQKSIQNAIKEIKAYQKWLDEMSNKFSQKLAEYGMKIAKAQVDGLYGDIEFSIEQDGIQYSLIGLSRRQHVEWDEGFTNDYSPLLMAEYGSGRYADAKHRGTFPNQKNANKKSWSWHIDGVRYSSSGEQPTRPMSYAYTKMSEKIIEIAMEVFSEE